MKHDTTDKWIKVIPRLINEIWFILDKQSKIDCHNINNPIISHGHELV